MTRFPVRHIVESVRTHPDVASKYQDNPDPDNLAIAFEKMLQEVMLKRRKEELELYKLFANDPAFKAAWQQSVERFVRNEPHGRAPDQGRAV